MSDRGTFVLCAVVCVAAVLAVPVPRWLALTAVVVAFVSRRTSLVVLAGALLASSLAAAAWSGLTPPAPGAVVGRAVLAGDPEDAWGAVRVDLRLEGRRVEAWARGSAASALRARSSGDVVRVRGRLRAPPPAARMRLAVRHVAARMEVEHVEAWAPGSLANRAANLVRRTLATGARTLDVDDRSLLLGVVLGNDREQPPALEEAFRGAGLSHLLAVSGQNVAFVLALAGPALRRMGLRGRWVATLSLLGFFGLLTRWEPSVLRAGAMAALACTAATMGRPAARVRLLALAVTGVVLVDPVLVHAVGFQLSVGATLGIALLAGPVGQRLRGPRWVAEPLAVTVAAQVGVAPVALPLFGGIPLASLPANLLAVPAAAPLTAWGLTGGVLAGAAGPPFDRWLHAPTRLLAGWLGAVARWSDALPLGDVRASHAVAITGLAAVVGLYRWRSGAAAGASRVRLWSWPWDRTASTSRRGRSSWGS